MSGDANGRYAGVLLYAAQITGRTRRGLVGGGRILESAARLAMVFQVKENVVEAEKESEMAATGELEISNSGRGIGKVKKKPLRRVTLGLDRGCWARGLGWDESR